MQRARFSLVLKMSWKHQEGSSLGTGPGEMRRVSRGRRGWREDPDDNIRGPLGGGTVWQASRDLQGTASIWGPMGWRAGQQEECLSWAPTKCSESPGGLQMRSCMEASTLNPSLDLDVSLVGADHQARFLSQVSSSASLLFSSLGASLKSPSLGHQLDSP